MVCLFMRTVWKNSGTYVSLNSRHIHILLIYSAIPCDKLKRWSQMKADKICVIWCIVWWYWYLNNIVVKWEQVNRKTHIRYLFDFSLALALHLFSIHWTICESIEIKEVSNHIKQNILLIDIFYDKFDVIFMRLWYVCL